MDRFYRQFGKAGLKERKCQNYDVSFRLKVIKTINKELSCPEIALQRKPPTDTILLISK